MVMEWMIEWLTTAIWMLQTKMFLNQPLIWYLCFQFLSPDRHTFLVLLTVTETEKRKQSVEKDGNCYSLKHISFHFHVTCNSITTSANKWKLFRRLNHPLPSLTIHWNLRLDSLSLFKLYFDGEQRQNWLTEDILQLVLRPSTDQIQSNCQQFVSCFFSHFFAFRFSMEKVISAGVWINNH